MDDCVGRHVEILAVAAPEGRRHVDAGGPVTEPDVVVGVGGPAEAVLAAVAPLAVPAGQVLFQRHAVTRFDAPAGGGHGAQLRDDAHVFVAEDVGLGRPAGVRADVAAADAGRLDPQQARIGGNVG